MMTKQELPRRWRSTLRISGACLVLVVGAAVLGGCAGTDATGNGDNLDGTEPTAGATRTPADTEIAVTTQGQGSVSQVARGGLVTLTAEPDAGWAFDGWSRVDSQANPLTVRAADVTQIEARFVLATTGDADQDGVPDVDDACLGTLPGSVVDEAGCAASQRDTDGDGVHDHLDACSDTPAGATVDDTGCAASQLDDDADTVANDQDACPDTPARAVVDAEGCAASQRDTDSDGVPDDIDLCPGTLAGLLEIDEQGCAPGDYTAPAGGGDQEPDDVCASATGDCYTAHGGLGCADADCCATVCESMSTCCSESWDENCAMMAAYFCPSSEAPSLDACSAEAGDCYAAHDSPGCNDVSCCTDICTYLPSCCNDAWGENCAVGALYSCGLIEEVCGVGDEACDAAHTGPGCEDYYCCFTVCSQAPSCCTETWDADCAALALANCDIPSDPVCGNGVVEYPEQCDDGNTTSGDGCDASCRYEAGDLANDNCASPATASDGATAYTNIGATTDGPTETGLCASVDLQADVWYCYTATCTDAATFSLCNSDFDTTLAVYEGCACPTASPLACDDDYCGGGSGSQVSLAVTAGQSYLVRIGGWSSSQGSGQLEIACGPVCGNGIVETGEECEPPGSAFCDANCQLIEGADVCGPGAGDCYAANGTPGCEDVTCCSLVCDADAYCCEIEWDSICAGSAPAICGGGYDVCATATGDCYTQHTDPGCNDPDCCNAVCTYYDPYCCTNEWDEYCVAGAGLFCDAIAWPACGSSTESCDSAHTGPGCSDADCCNFVCSFDPSCCTDEWTLACAQTAQVLCPMMEGCGADAGACREANGSPGCSDPTCCALVCVMLDPSCCSTGWSESCAEMADMLSRASAGAICDP